MLILSLLISVLFGALILTVTYFYNKYDLDVAKLTSINNGIKVYSADGSDNTLYNTNRSIVELETLPSHVKNAFIDIEDKRFYSHNGYDLKRIVKSTLINFITKSKSQGASTISQQLIKNALLNNEKTYSRKVQEIVLSIKMEKQFSKDEILEMYLNTIYFGSNAYGIENASKIYFNKSARELTLNESCCLAGLIKSPAYYSPRHNHANSIERRNLVAKRMLNAGNISVRDYESVVNSTISVVNHQVTNNSYEKEAIFEACKLLNLTERDLINRNYQIITFKDDNLQEQVVKANNEIIENAENSTDSTLDSLSIVANNDGHVLSYYSNSNYDLHCLSRQPASTLKPLAVYLPCFEHNILSPTSIILDEEINYNGYTPKNADHNYHGFVTCRKALSESLNIPAVKALDYLGVKKSKEFLTNIGINISNSDLNLSLALGAVKNGVNLLDLVSAYTTLANSGNYSSLCFVDQILDENGKVVYSHENYPIKVADAGSCYLVTDILKDCATTGTAKRLASLGINIASKTGTASNDKGNTDLFNVAYTTEHTMLSWIADIDKGTLSQNLLSSSQPTDINKKICEQLYKTDKPADFAIPDNIIMDAYDLIELEKNHILVQPTHKVERYIAYDYFKTDNLPKPAISNQDFTFDVSVDKSGAYLSFDAKKCENYNIFKQTKEGEILLESLNEKHGNVTFKDDDIFRFSEISYYITNSKNERIGHIKTIRPQDYLINLLNNKIISNKKKWLV